MTGLAGASVWEFWPLIHQAPLSPPPPGWTPMVTVIAGTGVDGRLDGLGISGRFSEPFALAVHGADLVVADAGTSNAIRRLTSSGQLSTIAGGTRGFRDGPRGVAEFDMPSGVAIDAAGTIYVADTGNHAIRRVAPDGTVTTIAGDGSAGFQDGRGQSARFNAPIGIAARPDRRLARRRQLQRSDSPRRLRLEPCARWQAMGRQGCWTARRHPPASTRQPESSSAPTVASPWPTPGNDAIRRISSDGQVTTVRAVDSAGAPFFLARPIGLVEFPDGRLYVAERRGIVEIQPDGVARFLAGAGSGYLDGPGTQARFRSPTGLVTIDDGALIVSDAGNRMLRRLEPPGRDDARASLDARIAPGVRRRAVRRNADPLAARSSGRPARSCGHRRRGARQSRRRRPRAIPRRDRRSRRRRRSGARRARRLGRSGQSPPATSAR